MISEFLQTYNFDHHKITIEEAWKDYVTNVSDRVYATSLELACFIKAFIEHFPIESIADLGSGFSTFVIRKYSKNPLCITVDDDARWMEKTAGFLHRHSLDTENMMTVNEFSASYGQHTFDLIIHDIGLAHRLNMLPFVFTHSKYLILDDMHFGERPEHKHLEYYPVAVRDYIAKNGFISVNLKRFTKDSFGRYSYLCQQVL